MSTECVSVVGGSSSGRRLARRLARKAGFEVADAPRSRGDGVRAALLHLPAVSETTLEEARRLVRDLAPTPVVALSVECGHAGCFDLRALGLGGCVPLSSDQGETTRSLKAILSALDAGGDDRCPHCPLGFQGASSWVCSSSGPGARLPEWTGHDTGGALCFPFVAVAPSMVEMQRLARRVASSDATVLITGESGTGKEVLARYIHRQGIRSRAPFVKVNCAALPEPLLESEMFGYEKGAFTGAGGRKVGRIEGAEGGVLFLDEISEMSPGLQAKLLQVLEAKSFHRLGGLGEIEVDVQIIAATNRALEGDVSSGRFREDLYFRLRVIELHLPPLRERREDIPRLVDYFLCRLSRHYSRPVPTVTPTLLEALREAPWAGNVRELENALRRLVILGEDHALLDEISKGNGSGTGKTRAAVASNEDGPALRKDSDLKEIARAAARKAERDAILAALGETRWNRSQAARLLGVSYKTLLTKMKQLLPRQA
ncbi:MAG: sigma 54-interacting transcriptional regulator [Acidobacteria bacterium]|nr:sigma 54-interacting transcriptional regulator [Acidobacteriota bacterium]